MKFEHCYNASNSNQVPTVVDWGKNNLICYGSCNTVMIYNPNYGSGGKVTNILMKHTKRVNSVKWLCGKQISYETELISGSTDSTVCVWKLVENYYEPEVLEGHSSNVNIVDGLQRIDKSTLIVSISMDHTAKIWYRQHLSDTFVLNQTLNFGYHLVVSVKLTLFPNSNEPLLLCALDDSRVHVFTETQSESLQFDAATILEGHEDWVRGLDFTEVGDDLLLATCSQDAFIRLWHFTPKSLGETIVKKAKLKTASDIFNIYLESVISGHESWIYSVKWSLNGKQLLSASIDKSMIIWEFDDTSELWLEKLRVGEIGGNTLGFYGGLFGPKGDMILGYSYHGAFHMWKYCEKLSQWVPSVKIGGHFDEVVDCSWEPKGQFLFTTSADQTTRIHAPWKQNNKEVTWHEFARPQVHGYDINSMAVISRYLFASGAEEKVIRIFKAPVNFIENMKRICNISEDEEGDYILNAEQTRPKGASVPSLGLSNKAVYSDDNIESTISLDKKNPYPEESQFISTELTEPPTEETLLQNTLWPETQKLYGHGYEVYCLAASPDGKYLASACKSTKPEHSAVLLWDSSNWKLIQKLMSHTLTVVQLQFSPDSNHLLSVSRDRRWSLFSKILDGQFELQATIDKTTTVHSRIIWTCCWSHDSKYFATGSRDGKIAVWCLGKDEELSGILGRYKLASEPFTMKNESVTALAFAPDWIGGNYLLAVGLENGCLELFKWCPQKWEKLSMFLNRPLHNLTIKKLSFRPVFGEAGKNDDKDVLQLATCSLDCSVNILNIFINK
ncbi:elongator complex protein 2 isoform X1 [Diorhabda carinulata]|uniref:elongator complex protein 2 isoform X1 n=2 Tax=Diorhabda carinulata TaxID=1163345 RepID=UPI0025A0B618|nr:elongator complex protein 2 isoform X1 [Diorhabda carinulata]